MGAGAVDAGDARRPPGPRRRLLGERARRRRLHGRDGRHPGRLLRLPVAGGRRRARDRPAHRAGADGARHRVGRDRGAVRRRGDPVIRPVNAAVLSSQWAPHVVAPPHDTFTPTTREQYLAQNPDSFMHVTDAPEHNVGHPSEHGIVAARSAAALSRLIDIGAYGAETGPHLFAQRIEVRGYTQNSLLGAVRTDEGALLPHEGTHSARVHGLAAHFAEVGLMSNPVVATCRSTAAASAAIAAARERGHDAAVLDAETADGARITLWSVDPDTAADLAGGSPLYIVDGHHRVAAAALAGFEQVLVSIVPTDELTLGSFDRVVSEITVMG
ncbi:MAG TPA: hypothetical protein DEP66_02080, partial [Acidimicrobiaceae bacterium]|nr:hypothetical protein [Acidimicrobiaceae bacterium]